MKSLRYSFLFLITFFLFSTSTTRAQQTNFSIDYEKFTLENGLEVVFHQDDSDPVTAVALTFHVGSAREKEGKQGLRTCLNISCF